MSWQEAVRIHVEQAWDAIEEAQLELIRQCKVSQAPELLRFSDAFERASRGLVDVVLDPLYPAT
jgi:hypothetical protein